MAAIRKTKFGALLIAILWAECAGSTDAAQPRITHLSLRLAIYDQTRSVEGTAEFRYVASGETVDAFSFAQRDLQITKIEAEPQPVRDYRVDKGILNITVAGSPAGKAAWLRVHYRAQPKEGLFFHRTLTETGVPVEQVWQFEDWDYWMPKPAGPDQLMDWELIAEVRSDWQVVSNGELISAEMAANRRVYHWRQPIPARFDGFTFAAGNFEIYEHRVGMRHVVNYVPAGVTDAGTVARSLGRAPQMLDLFSREFGEYPFGSSRQVILWDYHPQGTEHLGLACLSENKLFEENARLDANDYIVAHELSHDWWAILVAAKSPAHLWLTEGFAVYFGYQFFESADGRDEFEYWLKRRLRTYLDEDRKYRRVLVTDDPVPQPGGLDEHIYSKGAYILHMLRRYIGDEKFFAGLHRFAQQHAYGRADSADFQLAMEEASGQKLDWYFRQWLYGKGYPVFDVTHVWDEHAHKLTLTVQQVQDTSAGLYRMPLRVGLVDDSGEHTYAEIFSQAAETRTYPVSGELRYVRFDADNSLLGVVKFPRPANELIAQAELAEDAMGRVEALDALATISVLEVARALQHALRFDLFHGVRSAAAAALSQRGAESVPVLLQALATETDSRVLQSVVAGLEPFATKPEVADALKLAAASNPHPYVRARALLALARGKVAGTREMLVQALKQNAHRDVVRVSAFQAYAELGDKGALPEIIRYLESERTTRFGREAAVDALGRLGKDDAHALALLERISKDDFWPGVRENARRALKAQ